MADTETLFLARENFQLLLDALMTAGYGCVGPQVRNGAIVYDRISAASQFPSGISGQQQPAQYTLEKQEHQRLFAWANGPQAIKPYVFASRENLWRSVKKPDGSLEFNDLAVQATPLAIIGVRACDIAALFIQDKHFLQVDHKDPCYLARRQQLFLVAVNCTHPAATCFCASTGDGPRVDYGYDLVLSELDDGYLVHAKSKAGMALADSLGLDSADGTRIQQADDEIRAAAQQQRTLPGVNIPETLFSKLEHPQWDDVASRCLSCSNCTMVCPTCFCHAEDDVPDLDGTGSTYIREWDSCFTQGHSYIHGITIRATTAQRYRQWLTHKFGSWYAQYGRSGCVGCGRCITWCPAGIDVTEELAALCEGESHA